jgi:hypothetical protein
MISRHGGLTLGISGGAPSATSPYEAQSIIFVPLRT